MKNADDNYVTDYNQIMALRIWPVSTNHDYWYASRSVQSIETVLSAFTIYCYGDSQVLSNKSIFLGIDVSGGAFAYNSYTRGLRPVFKLKPEIKVTGGAGTSASPYTLGA